MYQLSVALVLASASPRRRELLNGCGINFIQASADIDETALENEKPDQMVLRLAEAKAKKISQSHPNRYILAADTDVALNGKIYGKPSSKEEAKQMIGELSGARHEVFGGLALLDPVLKKIHTALSVTSVIFRNLTDAEILSYISTNEPYDKAGGYAAQEIGASFIKSIEGSYTNVVGLDLGMTIELFRKANILT